MVFMRTRIRQSIGWLPRWTGAALAATLGLAMSFPAAWGADLTVEVLPNHVRVQYAGTATFTVEARDADGNPVAGSTVWEVLPARLGTVGPDGVFTAQGIGRGIARVTVTAGEATGVGHAMITVTPLHELPSLAISIEPRQVSLEPGAKAQFRVLASDPASGARAEVTVEWRVVPERLGTIDAAGLFVASSQTGAGHVVARVIAADGTHTVAESRVVVGRPGPSDLQIGVSPTRAILSPGESRRFEAVLTREGRRVQPETSIEWAVLPPELGTIGTDGTLVAGLESVDGRVIATIATESGIARGYGIIAVRDRRESRLAVQVLPREAIATPGSEVRFEVTVLGPEGEIPNPVVEWEVHPASLGRMSPEGVLAVAAEPGAGATGAPAPLSGEVIARVRHRDMGAIGRARVMIAERPPDVWLQVTPTRATVTPGEQVHFSAEVMGTLTGNTVPHDSREVKFSWSVRPEELGTITPDGFFTASATVGNSPSPDFGRRDGIVTCEAVLPNAIRLSGTAMVVVRQAALEARLSLVPANVVLHPEEWMTFRLLLDGARAENAGVEVQWQVVPDDVGRIYPAGPSARFQAHAGIAGSRRGEIIATVTARGSKAAELRASVRIEPRRGDVEKGIGD